MTAPGDVLISLDADLQDDLEAIPKMLDAYRRGSEIVFAVRSRRDKDSFLKRFAAESYYKFFAHMGAQIIYNHADFRLMSRRAVETLREYDEPHLFLRALVLQLGFRSETVEFERAARFAGESKYPLGKMLALAWQGITSFSAYPLRLITGVGLAVSRGSIGLAAWALALRMFTDDALPGWASMVIPMYFLGGVQLLSLGVFGEYLAKVYESTKKRPRYHVEQVCGRRFDARGNVIVPCHSPGTGCARERKGTDQNARGQTTISGGSTLGNRGLPPVWPQRAGVPFTPSSTVYEVATWPRKRSGGSARISRSAPRASGPRPLASIMSKRSIDAMPLPARCARNW